MSDKVLIERELLEQISMDLAPYSEPAKELRALLASQPQSAPAGERDLFAPYRVAGEYCLDRNIADDCDYRVKIIDAFTCGAEWQRTQSAGVPVVMPSQCTDKAQHVKYRNGWNSCLSEVARLNRTQSAPAGEREAVVGGAGKPVRRHQC